MSTLEPSLDEVFELLADQRRRHVLYYLDQNGDEAVTLDELTAKLVQWNQTWDDGNGKQPNELQTSIRVSLHHNHLPRLADAGLIEYDARSETVRDLDPPSVMDWAENNQQELPYLRSLFCTSAVE